MNEKEIGEIRRRVRRDRSNMTAIYGCYVNSQKQIVAEFKQGTGTMPENEAEKYFGTLKRVLSGSVGKNLIDINFRTSQVASSEEHKLLMDLRKTELKDDSLRNAFYEKVIGSVSLDESFVILMGCDRYDVPFKSRENAIQKDNSEEVYTYLLCAVCPVKLAKPTLRYIPEEKLFHDGGANNIISAPEMGFLFPAFDDRATNIYNALYYTRSPKQSHESFVEAVFNAPVPKPAAEQKKSFEALLASAVGQDCSLEVVQTVHDQICQSIAMHKESRVEEPLLISKEQVKDALSMSGVGQVQVARFSVAYDEVFGAEAELHPKNIINSKRFEIKTPDVSITVAPERSDLIETRIIGGVKYLLINAEDNVEVNGVPIHIAEEDQTQ